MKEFTNEMKVLKSELENLKFQVSKTKKRTNILEGKLIQIKSHSRHGNLLAIFSPRRKYNVTFTYWIPNHLRPESMTINRFVF